MTAQRQICRFNALGSLILIFTAAFGAQSVRADDEQGLCATEDPGVPLGGTITLPEETTTEMKGLFVFVRFSDDNTIDWNNDWPIDTTITDTTFAQFDAVPAWADTLMEDSGTSLPSVDGSFRDYFHLMSRGKFDFNSAFYDSVVVLDKTTADYAAGGGGGLEAVFKDAMEVVAADATFDLGAFATTRTGVAVDSLDFVGFILRSVRNFDETTCAGQNILNTSGQNGETKLDTHLVTSAYDGHDYRLLPWLKAFATGLGTSVPLADVPDPIPPGGIDCSCAKCPVMDLSLRSIRQTMTHEMGHSLFRGGSTTISGRHTYSLNDWSLMHSNVSGRESESRALCRSTPWVGPALTGTAPPRSAPSRAEA